MENSRKWFVLLIEFYRLNHIEDPSQEIQFTIQLIFNCILNQIELFFKSSFILNRKKVSTIARTARNLEAIWFGFEWEATRWKLENATYQHREISQTANKQVNYALRVERIHSNLGNYEENSFLDDGKGFLCFRSYKEEDFCLHPIVNIYMLVVFPPCCLPTFSHIFSYFNPTNTNTFLSVEL